MSVKRKDKSGKVLCAGESQRKNGTYMYRYPDKNKKMHAVYAPTLELLRQKKAEIEKEIERGVDVSAPEMSVGTLVEESIKRKGNLRYQSQQIYADMLKRLQKIEFAGRSYKSIKVSDAKVFMVDLQEEGCGYWTIEKIFTLCKCAYQEALEDDLIYKNPFCFRLCKVIQVRPGKKTALTPEQQEKLLQFMANSGCYSKYLDAVQVMLGTGLRISEFCGLTLDDVDLVHKKLFVRKQISRRSEGVYVLAPPKTKSSERVIPMSDAVYAALCRTVQDRKQRTMANQVSGRDDILWLRYNDKFYEPQNWRTRIRNLVNAFNETTDDPIQLTPHIFRHTFCTNLMRSGVDIKTIQYLMGHTTIDMTINTYTHTTYEDVERAFNKYCSGM